MSTPGGLRPFWIWRGIERATGFSGLVWCGHSWTSASAFHICPHCRRLEGTTSSSFSSWFWALVLNLSGCSRGVHAYLREKDQFTSRGVRCAFTLRLGARQTHLIFRGTGIVPGLCKLTGRAQVHTYCDGAIALLSAPSQAHCGHWLGGFAQVHGPFSMDYLDLEAALVLSLLGFSRATPHYEHLLVLTSLPA